MSALGCETLEMSNAESRFKRKSEVGELSIRISFEYEKTTLCLHFLLCTDLVLVALLQMHTWLAGCSPNEV